ncbi:glutathione S-transferase N-terminal domain-containing protein [Candidatus Kaiserbacteria bacterium]|nr:glutathione S-transferase N-terminal domain-containing protein [Candidatus Kaiserbacteria bacterium]
MLTLYVKTGCPFCAKALKKVGELGLQIEEKNIADDAVAAELVARGGKRQVPYLVDTDKNVEMYESDDIVTYLGEHYGKGDTKKDGGGAQTCTLG